MDPPHPACRDMAAVGWFGLVCMSLLLATARSSGCACTSHRIAIWQLANKQFASVGFPGCAPSAHHVLIVTSCDAVMHQTV